MNILCYIYPDMADFELTLLLHRLHQRGCRVLAASEHLEPVTAQSGLRYLPDLTLRDAEQQPLPDALLLPGGPIRPEQNAVCPLVQRMDDAGRLIGAICFAPQFLARAGVLAKHDYTTSCSAEKMAALGLRDFFPRDRMRHARVVEDGHVITAQGFAFVDFAEAVCLKLGVAQPPEVRAWFAPVRGTGGNGTA